MSIEQELKEVIAKNLPQTTGELLQQRLAKADDDARRLESVTTDRDSLREKLQNALSTISDLKEQLSKHLAIDVREKEVATRERDAEISSLRVQLHAEQSNTKFARDVALGLVRNTDYRRTAFDTETRNEPIVPAGSTYSTGTATSNNNRNTTVTETAS